MAIAETLLFGAVRSTAIANAVAGTATATQAAPGLARRLYIVGFVVSASTTSTAAGTVSVKSGTTDKIVFDMPIGLDQPFYCDLGNHPIECGENESASIAVTTFGAGVTGRVTLLTVVGGV